jgi:hypothetical protein
MLASALRYAAAGVPVLPLHTGTGDGGCSCRRPQCDRPGKHPRWHPRLITAGLHQASTDPAQLRRWWATWPEANVGLRTGVVVDVCDVDTADGLRLVQALVDREVPTVRTGSGGLHLYFAATGLPNRVRVLPGVDWRGVDGYVVAPPSTHASGERYRWIMRGPAPLCPPVLRALVAPPPEPPLRPPTEIRHPSRYAAAALDNEAERVRRAPVGTRNNTLYSATRRLGRLAAAGLLDERDVVDALTPAARLAGLGAYEIARTIRSGLAGARTRLAS